MKISNHSAVPVYTISGSSTARPLPEWLARKRKRSLKSDPEYASRVELLQDFEFEEASQCIRVSEDGQWVMSTAHVRTNAVELLYLTSLEIHTPQGCHYTTRLPRYGRDLKYERRSAEALIPAVGVNEHSQGEVFRLNLEVGRFLRGYEVDVGGDDPASLGGGALQGSIGAGSVNAASVAEASHNLLAFGTSLGTVEFFDPRSRGRIGKLPASPSSYIIDGRPEITALEFDHSGLGIATGSSVGLIHLYDLRSPIPLLKKDQGYGYPIQDIIFLKSTTSTKAQTSEPKILSADKRIIKIWDSHDGSPWTSVEPAVDMNSVAWCSDSGMLLTANEGRQQHAFFIPQLGPAPKWCSFLDNLVEEMAEDPNDPNAFTSQKAGDVYDNYKFLTMQQLEKLNLAHLVGTTSLLRPYMHGFFVAQRLYEEAKMIADPFVWEEQRNKRVKEKIDAERESRIRGKKKVAAKVNRRLAEKIMDRTEKNERRRAQKVIERGGDESPVEDKPVEGRSDLLSDPRFTKLFQDEDFAIDETSREFQLLNPSTKPIADSHISGTSKLTAVEQEDMDEVPKSDMDSPVSSDDEAERAPTKNKANDSGRISSSSYRKSGHRPKQPQMRVAFSNVPRESRDHTFGFRAERHKTANNPQSSIRGEREITFAPLRKTKTAEREEPKRRRDEGRRSASGNVLRNM
ncbi:MAG: hypothetical protein Q9191_006535 [Dirinaria sp. TL-2023a]